MDHDLSDIMKEIEALEKDFRQEEKEFAKSPIIQELAQLNEELSAPVGITAAPAEDQTFDWLQGDNNKAEPLDVSEAEIFEMKAAPEVAPAPATPPVAETAPATVAHLPHASATPAKAAKKTAHAPSKSKMSFNFPDEMPVQIEFHKGEQVVNFSWTEEGFQVEVDGGMSFSIPIQQCYKKAS